MTTMTEKRYTGELVTLDKSGDTRIMWDKNNEDEIQVARAAFDRLTRDNKYSAFHATGREGKKGERMRAFDPEAERIVFVKQLVGG